MRSRARMRVIAASLMLACPLVLGAPVTAQSQSYAAVRSAEPLRDRIAYLLTLLASDANVRAALLREPAVSTVLNRLAVTHKTLLAQCEAAEPPACPVEQLMLTDAEIDNVAAGLERAARTDRNVAAMVAQQLRPSGRYQLHAAHDDPALLAAAWRDTASALNRIYRLYALGQKPVYPAIDSLDRDPKQPRYQNRLAELIAMGAALGEGGDIFAAWSRPAFDLLILAQRDEAARYEPLDTGANGAANKYARSLRWKSYPYTAIIVPGNGLETSERAVSPIGVLRLQLAVERWRQGLAPLIIMSGGHVHPNRSEFSEAVEMKKILMARFDVPEKAILIDPYARHTTTNLRNVVRLLFRVGAPMDRPFLVTSSPGHAAYVADAGEGGLIVRSQRELGYVPYRDAKMVSSVDASVMPDVLALQLDPDEPLDP